MKKNKLIYLVSVSLAALLICSCKGKNNSKEDTTVSNSEPSTSAQAPQEETKYEEDTTGVNFDINSIPETDKLTGSFPYFKLPTGYHFTNPYDNSGTGQVKDYDKEYFMVHGVYVPQEGKSFKAEIHGDDGKEYSNLELQKNFDEFIQGLGGVITNNGDPLKDEEEDRLKKLDPRANDNRYLFTSAVVVDVHTYVLRTKEKTVWVQINFSGEDSHIAILETKSFKNGMSQT